LPAADGGSVPVVAVTAYGEVHGPDRTLLAGFQAHVRKPIDPWELCTILVGLTRRS
jgi:CheY-like chemotaxis protein